MFIIDPMLSAGRGDEVGAMKIEKSLVVRFALTATLAVAVTATGCGRDGGSNGGSGGSAGAGGSGGEAGSGGVGGSIEPCTGLCAEPPSTSFPTRITVELTTDTPGATIYYTTDLTPVLDEDGNVQGTTYTQPISISETAVLKFLEGVDSGAGGAGGGQTFSPEQMEGYTRTNGDSKFEELAESGHGDLTGEAWRHWDEDGEVPSSCAKCHGAMQNSAPLPNVGFLEFAQTGGNVNPAPLPLGLQCVNCHQFWPTLYSNLDVYGAMEPVDFPSGAGLSLFSPSNICMTCHQGRESGLDVLAIIESEEPPYSFINIHYYPAAASMFGGEANGGFQYPDLDYRPRNTFPSHPDNFANCVGCHMKNAEDAKSHTWVPVVSKCTGCHDEGDSFETLRGSPGQSYENLWGADGGSGGLIDDLYAAIQGYATDEISMPIIYDGDAYPYWFNDNGMGANYGNRYVDFDAKLLAAAYNYQVAQKDPAGYIHNGTYVQQLLYDSTMDLGGTTAVEVIGRGDLALNGPALDTASKTQQWQLSGHGATDEEPFRHWDEEGGEVPSSCAKCHTTSGFAQFATSDPITSHTATSGVDCWSCHTSFNLFVNSATRWDVSEDGDPLEPVEFPSGALLTLNNSGNLCMSCHQGRSSGLDVDTQDPNNDETANSYPSFDFVNIHYYAAAAVLFGSEANGGYQYDNGKPYRGRNTFVGLHDSMGRNLTDCLGCHMNSDPDTQAKHTFLPREVDDCSLCHSGGPRFRDLNTAPRTNWNAIQDLKAQLLVALEAYATTGNAATGLPQDSPVQYEGDIYPYWFHEGVPAIYPNRYRDFDRTMLRAAYNFVVADKDPGAYIHNGTYIQQLLWDSIIDLGACPNLNPPPQGRDPVMCP
jgi:hypothetical protein